MDAGKPSNRSGADKWPIWLPTPGNIAFTLLAIGILLWANSAGAVRLLSSTTDEPALTNTSSSTISYQGYLADSSGNPVNATVDMVFNLYSVESGGTAVWSEAHTVTISDGLFSVLLGSQTPLSTSLFTANDNLWLGITVGTDEEMTPREKIASAPFAILANVADGSITQSKLASSAVTTNALANTAVTSDKLANGAVTTARIANNAVNSDKLANNAVTSARIANGAVTTTKIANGAVTQEKAPSLLRGPGNNWRVQVGTAYRPPPFSGGWYETTVNFPNAFSSNPNVVITVVGSAEEIVCWKHYGVRAVTTSSFVIRTYNDDCGWLGTHFSWVAIGP